MISSNRILLIDDQPNVLPMIKRELETIGLKPQIDFICPEDNDLDYVLSILPEKDDLNDYDLALIDLELTNTPKNAFGYLADDLLGGSAVLPYLRDAAPWLPVVAVSQLFNKEELYFVGIGGGFGFDGHLEKHVVSSNTFNQDYWNGICKRAHLRRLESAIGHYHFKQDHKLDFVVCKSLENLLDDKTPSWRILFNYLFYFAQRVSVQNISGGFSGAFTLEVNAITTYKDISTNNRWFVKLSANPYKLHQESQAHRNMFYSCGLEYARSLPLMYSHAIKVNECAAIGYQFASGADVASRTIDNSKSFSDSSARLQDLFHDFYVSDNFCQKEDLLFDVVSNWFSSDSLRVSLKQNLKKIDLVKSVVNREQSPATESIIKYTSTVIHGDLHLGNVLLGDRDIFIDFARSGHGPLVADFAKFIFDTSVKIPDMRQFVSSFEEIVKNPSNLFSPLLSGFDFKNNDRSLFDIFIYLHFAQALGYSDIDETTKQWIVDEML